MTGGSAVRTVVGASASILALGAAAPRPVGTGTTVSSSTHAHAAPPLAAPATTRLALADRRRAAANRPGFSTRCMVITASPADTSVAANLPGSPAGSPSNSGISSSTGQCHRYHEYETRPTARIAGWHNTRPAPMAPVAQPPPITSAVPSTGMSAAVPGYGVLGPSWVQVSTINASPPHPTIAAGSSGSRRHCRIERATRPPTANSQARVGSEKNAQGGDVWVQITAAVNDATVTNVRTTTNGVGRNAVFLRTRRTSHAVPMINTGQTR